MQTYNGVGIYKQVIMYLPGFSRCSNYSTTCIQ